MVGRYEVRDGPGPVSAEWAPSRHVALEGAVNVRDIGGYRSASGLEVMHGRLFRGDSLSQLTTTDTERLDQLGLRTVIDFRTPGEILLSGTDRLPFGVEFASLPVSGGDLGSVYELIASGDHERQRRELGDGRAASFMVEISRGFVADPRQREAFGAALRLLCSASWCRPSPSRPSPAPAEPAYALRRRGPRRRSRIQVINE